MENHSKNYRYLKGLVDKAVDNESWNLASNMLDSYYEGILTHDEFTTLTLEEHEELAKELDAKFAAVIFL